jgi:hypothetical protein
MVTTCSYLGQTGINKPPPHPYYTSPQMLADVYYGHVMETAFDHSLAPPLPSCDRN